MSPAQQTTRYIDRMTTAEQRHTKAREWVGRNLQRLRAERNLTVEQFAQLVSERAFKIDKSQISRIETGKQSCDSEKLLAFADALEVNPDRLLCDPERLDAALFVRILRHWREADREAKAQAALAEILHQELTRLAERIPPPRSSDWSFYDFLGEDAIDLFTRPLPSIESVEPTDPEYIKYLERLAAGELDIAYSLDPDLYAQASEPKRSRVEMSSHRLSALRRGEMPDFEQTSRKSKSKTTKKGGK